MDYPDVFFTPEYQEIFKDTAFGGNSVGFNSSGIDYRFYSRTIGRYKDIVSPYGYSGAIEVEKHANWNEFAKEFCKYCNSEGIIVEFSRLHPFIGQLEGTFAKGYEHDVSYIDLSDSLESIRHNYDKGCKSAIKKAIISGVFIIFTDSIPKDFCSLYTETMKRLGADESYCFNQDFFDRLNYLLQGHFLVANVVWNQRVISSAIILHYGNYAHYFLAGNNAEFRQLGGNNLLIDCSVKAMKDMGCKIFSLGGGLKKNDSLSSFKKSFTPLSKPFYTYRKVHNQEVYNQLCQAKGIDPNSEGYFPAYRR